MQIQLDLFQNEKISELEAKMTKVKDSADSVRRGIFARYDKMVKANEELVKNNQALEQKLDMIIEYLGIEKTEIVDIQEAANG